MREEEDSRDLLTRAGARTLTRPQRCAVALLGLLAGPVAMPVHSTSAADRVAPAGSIGPLLAAYPDHLERIEANALVWKDGTRMMIDDGRGPKSHEVRLATADLKDMLAQRYRPGPLAEPPARHFDPGRARNAAFFDKMYGDCRNNAVASHLVDMVWLPRKWGRTVPVTRINGVAARLAEVSRALDALPSHFDVFLFPPAGTYNCRVIAGTNRASAHGHGIAIDLALGRSDYWRWAGVSGDRDIVYKNRMPTEIVAIFEDRGFIWGGKWYHYDTMHFEYRPELLIDHKER